MGEARCKALVSQSGAIALDTLGANPCRLGSGRGLHAVRQLLFFIEFLKVSGAFEARVADCPLSYHSNYPSVKRAVLAILLLSILTGHHRDALFTAIRHDGIHRELLGVSRLISEDAARRALAWIEESSGVAWLDRHLATTTEPLLTRPWMLDLDAPVKCLYGKQEGVVVGYNPKKLGRPAHSCHSALVANTRLALAVDVRPGNGTAPMHSLPGIWAWWDTLPREARPALLRGDVAFGSESVLCEAEAENKFDELKNQWSWGGFTTQDLARCRLMARMVELVYNWWTLFVWLAQPHTHFEAISRQPLLLHGVAMQTQHAGQARLAITSLYAKQ